MEFSCPFLLCQGDLDRCDIGKFGNILLEDGKGAGVGFKGEDTAVVSHSLRITIRVVADMSADVQNCVTGSHMTQHVVTMFFFDPIRAVEKNLALNPVTKIRSNTQVTVVVANDRPTLDDSVFEESEQMGFSAP